MQNKGDLTWEPKHFLAVPREQPSNPVHIHLPALPLQTLRRDQRESARELDTFVWVWCWLGVV